MTPIAQTFALDVMKVVVEPAALPGETAIFEITVENAGNVTLSDVSILEENLERADGTTLGLDAAPIFQGSSLRSSEGTLLPGEISRYRVAYTLTQDDLDAGGIRNSVRVSGGPPQGAPFTDVSDDGDDGDGNVLNDPTELIIEAAPALALVKSLAKGTVDTFDAVGQTIGYTFEVTNTGNVSITEPIEIVDARLTDAGGTLTCPPLPKSTAPIWACSEQALAMLAILVSGSGEFRGTSMRVIPAEIRPSAIGTASYGVIPRRMAIRGRGIAGCP